MDSSTTTTTSPQPDLSEPQPNDAGNQFCRACLGPSQSLRPIFKAGKIGGQIMRLADMLAACTNLDICDDDGLPEHLCGKCAQHLCRAFTFIQLCIRSDDELRLRIEQQVQKQFMRVVAGGGGGGGVVVKRDVEIASKPTKAEDPEIPPIRSASDPDPLDDYAIDAKVAQRLRSPIQCGEYTVVECSNELLPDDNQRIDDQWRDVAFAVSSGPVASTIEFIAGDAADYIVDQVDASVEEDVVEEEDEEEEEEEADEMLSSQGFEYRYEEGNEDGMLVERLPDEHGDEEPEADEADEEAEELFSQSADADHEEEPQDGDHHHYGQEVEPIQLTAAEVAVANRRQVDRERVVIVKSRWRRTGTTPIPVSPATESIAGETAVPGVSGARKKPRSNRHPPSTVNGQKSPAAKATIITTTGRPRAGGRGGVRPPGPPFECAECHKMLSNYNSWKYHMQLHSDHKRFVCTVCGEAFRTPNAYDGHLVTHNANNPNTCTVCGKSYRQAASLRNHMLAHTGEKPFKCDICGKGMTQKSGYKKHMLTHSGEKPHQCDVCGKYFRYSSNLFMHRRVHSNERPHPCEQCGKAFVTGEQLKRHRSTHAGVRNYACDLCDKAFNRKATMLLAVTVIDIHAKFERDAKSIHRNRHDPTKLEAADPDDDCNTEYILSDNGEMDEDDDMDEERNDAGDETDMEGEPYDTLELEKDSDLFEHVELRDEEAEEKEEEEQ